MEGQKTSDSKLFAFLGVLLTFVGFIIVLLAKKNDQYAMYYGKQGLIIGVSYFILFIVNMILAFIPVVGWILGIILYLLMLVLWIIGIVYSFSGEMKPIPIIGKFAEKINL